MKSDVVNYETLEKSEMKGIISQKIVNLPKVKSKVIDSSQSLDVEWAEERINLNHLRLLLAIVRIPYVSSLFLNKIHKITQIFDDFILLSQRYQ
jgi:hypothetical protein